jgi:hypothetical protein
MLFSLVHEYLNAQLPIDLFQCMTFQLEKTLYVAFQKCIIHIFFLAFQSMEKISAYPLYVVALDPQSSNVQI